jgi:hypothetical protein
MIPCPDEEEPLYPCDTAHEAAMKMDSVYIKSNLDSVLNTIPNLSTEPNEKGFPIFQKFSVSPFNNTDTTFNNYVTGPVFTGTDSSINMNYIVPNLSVEVVMLHTHPSNGYPAPSAADVYEVINKRLDEYYFAGTIIIASNGNQYALTITDLTRATAFFNTQNNNLNGDKWNPDSEIGKAFKDAKTYFLKLYKNNATKENIAYEMAMATVLNQYNSGVTLNKKDSYGNFKPLVIKTTIPDPSKPKKKIYTQDCL